MIVIDLSPAARDEARRLTEARALIAQARPWVADGPLVGIARRHRVRAALGGRCLQLYRCAYEDAAGRVAHSTLIAITIARGRKTIDVRRARWTDATLLARIDHECGAWRGAAQRVTADFTVTRLSREQAIASNRRATAAPSFQPGLFDKRADNVHIALERDAADFSARLAARIAAIESAGALTLRPPDLLLVLIPRDAARV